MLARRIKRDTTERGRDVEGILDQCDHLSLWKLLPIAGLLTE